MLRPGAFGLPIVFHPASARVCVCVCVCLCVCVCARAVVVVGLTLAACPCVRSVYVVVVACVCASPSVQPLELDQALSDAADAHCTEMADYGYTGHLGLNGFKPYQRYFFGAECQHHVLESVGGQQPSGTDKFALTDEVVLERSLATHDQFMSGQAPQDLYVPPRRMWRRLRACTLSRGG